MVNESSQPKPGDAVLGGQNPEPLINAAVLGGIEGAKQRYADPDVKIRIGGLREAVKYGEEGIELLVHGLKDKMSEVGLAAYSLLEENVEPELKMVLEIDEPYQLWAVKSSNPNIVDPVRLFHSYLKIKQPQNSSLYQAFQALYRGTKAEKEATFLQLQSSEEPAIEAALRLYINELDPNGGVAYSRLKYFLHIKQWQSAQNETMHILIQLSGCPQGTAINEILKSEFIQSSKTDYGNSYRFVKRKISTDRLRFIYELWQKSVNASYSSVNSNFWMVFKNRIDQIIREDEVAKQDREKFEWHEECASISEDIRNQYSGNNWNN